MKLTSAASWLLATWVAAVSGTATVRADNWPQWRGPNNDGICKETNLPVEWSATKNVAWKLPLPAMAGATPAIWSDHVFLTSEDGGDLVLLCVSTDGKELWKRKLGSATRKVRNDEGNGASPSPSTDGKYVYAFVGSGDFACFDFAGQEVWKFNAQERYGKFDIQFGMHSTPVLHGNRLYFQLIHSAAAWVVAIDKATGKEIWKVERKSDGRGENKHSYASPVIWQNGKDAYLVTHGNDYAIAHRLEDGSEIWRVGELNPKKPATGKYRADLRFVTSPVATPDLIVVPSAKNHGIVGVKPSANGLLMPGNNYEQWRKTNNTPDVPSPLVYEGLVYLCGEGGVITCMDAKTGEEYYRQRVHSARYRASPVYADGKVYVTARDGAITVFKAGKKFEKLAENKLPDQISASPAISGGRIYVRGFEALYAIEAKK